MWQQRITDVAGVVFSVLAVLLTACNESSKPQADPRVEDRSSVITSMPKTRSPSRTPSVDVCAIMPIDTILATVGGTNPMGTTTSTDDHSDCSYRFTTASRSGGPLRWSVNVQVWDTSIWDYQRGLPSRNRINVPGLGDAAFTQADMGARDLWIKSGDKVISVISSDYDESERLTRKVAKLMLTYWSR